MSSHELREKLNHIVYDFTSFEERNAPQLRAAIEAHEASGAPGPMQPFVPKEQPHEFSKSLGKEFRDLYKVYDEKGLETELKTMFDGSSDELGEPAEASGVQKNKGILGRLLSSK